MRSQVTPRTAIQQAAARASTTPTEAAVWSRTKRSRTACHASEDATGTGQAPPPAFRAGEDASRASACMAARSGVVGVADVGWEGTLGSFDPTPPGGMPDSTTPVFATASPSVRAEDAAVDPDCAVVDAPRCTGSASTGTASGMSRISGSRKRWRMRQIRWLPARLQASSQHHQTSGLSVTWRAGSARVGAGAPPGVNGVDAPPRPNLRTSLCPIYSARYILC
jgi:hypothetical protein